MQNKILLLVTTVLLFFLLSFRITKTPMGLTVDESAFGWNAALLSATGHDENGVRYPLFVSSINHRDWRQPVTQYYLTLMFKIFRPSVYTLRISSVVIALVSAGLLFYLISKLLNFKIALISAIIFCTTPIVFMHSHLGLDNIMPVPFTLLWLIFIFLYSKNRYSKYLIFSAISLGISFYTYKGMRAVVPVWAGLTILYLIYLNYSPKIKLSKLIFKTSPFILTLLPFALIIPYLHHLYPGAIFGGARPKFNNIFDLVYYYLSHYDLTFLFIKGDDLLFHSTKIHGMYLLATLPFLLAGIYQAIRQNNHFYKFVLISFLSGPILYGFVESVHRASRIMCLVPLAIFLIALGLKTILNFPLKLKALCLVLISLLYILNFSHFANYYWFTYPKFTENIFGNLTMEESYKVLHQQASDRGLTPYVQSDIYQGFLDLIYTKFPSQQATINNPPPSGSIFLTTAESIPGFTNLDLPLPHFHLLISP